MNILGTVALSAILLSPAVAAANPSPGRWKTTINEEYAGNIWFGPVGDLVCAYYDGPSVTRGTITGKMAGSKLEGIWDEHSGEGKVSLDFSGKRFAGGYTENLTDTSTSPWTGSFDKQLKVKVSGKYDLDWSTGAEKTVVTFTQKGKKVTGKMVYRYSGSAGGTLSGTLYGDLLVGTWKSKEDDGSTREGVFMIVFMRDANTKKWDHIKGVYGSDAEHCGDSGWLNGRKTK
jgi:hypothetical protein